MKAFPAVHDKHLQEGMDLRDYFAAKIVGGVLSNSNIKDMPDTELAELAYSLADAMMEARK